MLARVGQVMDGSVPPGSEARVYEIWTGNEAKIKLPGVYRSPRALRSRVLTAPRAIDIHKIYLET